MALCSKKVCVFYRRQLNYMDILKGLNLGHKSAYDLTNQFHHVFWFGDLNYRIDLQYEVSSDDLQKVNQRNKNGNSH